MRKEPADSLFRMCKETNETLGHNLPMRIVRGGQGPLRVSQNSCLETAANITNLHEGPKEES